MSSKLDTPMGRSSAMVVRLLTPEMIERAKQLEHHYPDLCWVSNISTIKINVGQHKQEPTFYYFLRDGKYWINEEWIQTGEGSQIRS
jgi:hypothetical protein